MKIFIPTLGRVEEQVTWDRVPEIWRPHAYVVCPPDEAEQHLSRGRQVLSHPRNCKGIGKVRQWILEQCDDDKLVMIDDDHKFFHRIKKSDWRLRRATPKQMEKLFHILETNLDEVMHIGVGARQGNNFLEVPYMHNYRYNNMYGLRKSVLEKHDIRFDVMPLMEDFYINLSLLNKGYRNKVYTQMCWNQVGGSNAGGGCSSYRTEELQAKAANILRDKFPGFVSVVRRKSSTMWYGMEERTDVRIYWKKAYTDPTQGRFL